MGNTKAAIKTDDAIVTHTPPPKTEARLAYEAAYREKVAAKVHAPGADGEGALCNSAVARRFSPVVVAVTCASCLKRLKRGA
jgi:hypothetical protein